MMSINLLIEPPKCHRELFTWDKVKAPKTEYTIDDLKDYIILSFGDVTVNMSGGFTTVEAIEAKKKALIESARPMPLVEEEELRNLIDKHGLETILYAIDLLDTDDFHVYMLSETIPDAEVILAKLLRDMEYSS